MSEQPIGILLAAGLSQRFGSNKLLHRLTDNKPMVLMTAEKLASVLPNTVVVIHPQLSTLMTQMQQLGLHVVVNDQAQDGIGRSIARGVSASQDANGWLIALADMPFIKHETISLLVNRLVNSGKIIRPVYDKQQGHPVGFARRFKDELLELKGDIGARQVIDKNRSALELILTDDAGVIADIDHADDIKEKDPVISPGL